MKDNLLTFVYSSNDNPPLMSLLKFVCSSNDIMATPRRPFSTEEKPSLSRDPTIKDGKSNISPAVPSYVEPMALA